MAVDYLKKYSTKYTKLSMHLILARLVVVYFDPHYDLLIVSHNFLKHFAEFLHDFVYI